MKFRIPTVRKSIDLQRGHCARNNTSPVMIIDQEPAFRETSRVTRRPCLGAATCSDFIESLFEPLDQFLSLAACRL